MSEKKLVEVTNRSVGTTFYVLKNYKDKEKLRREFAPRQTAKIDIEELEALMYTAGGDVVLSQFLYIGDKSVLDHLNLVTEVEYDMNESDVIELLKNGTVDQLLDCLDYAPQGVLDLIKHYAVNLPLTDMQKIAPINKKFNFDVIKAIQNSEEEKEEKQAAGAVPTGRRATPITANKEESATNGIVVPDLVK